MPLVARAQQPGAADVVLRGGRVLTMVGTRVAEAAAASGGRIAYTYPAGSLEEAGARLCGGSDWPVDPLVPFRQIEMAVNRTADEVYEGYPQPLFRQEGLSLRRSLAMHTWNSAFQLHQETQTGQIRQGLAADLIVLDRDVLRVPLKRVSKSKVALTMVDGRVVHRAG